MSKPNIRGDKIRPTKMARACGENGTGSNRQKSVSEGIDESSSAILLEGWSCQRHVVAESTQMVGIGTGL